ncbi:MAG: hypothetical protein L0Y44_03505 [Phycisphaerales bacterium]|nr:hypothetical protein [Phycisphaerales bacterium]
MDDGAVCQILPTPPLTLEADCIGVFNIADFASIGGLGALSFAKDRFTLLRETQNEHEWHGVFSLGPNRIPDLEINLDSGPQWLFRSTVMRIFEGGAFVEGKTPLITEINFTIAEFADFDGMLLPRLAYRDSWRYVSTPIPHVGKSIPPGEGRVIYERLSAKKLLSNPFQTDLAESIFRNGNQVFDSAFRVNYRIGSNEAIVDGTPVVLKAPATLRLAHDLHRLVLSTDDARANLHQPSETDTRRATLVSIGAGVVTFILLLTILNLIQRHKRAQLS